jgi:hypothetical protein
VTYNSCSEYNNINRDDFKCINNGTLSDTKEGRRFDGPLSDDEFDLLVLGVVGVIIGIILVIAGMVRDIK